MGKAKQNPEGGEVHAEAVQRLAASMPGRWAVSRAEAAELLGISLRTVDLLVQAGELEHRRLGRRVVIPTLAVAQWLVGGGRESAA